MLAIRGNLTKKNTDKVYIQFSSLAGSTITVNPWWDLSYLGFTNEDVVDLFYGDVFITSDGRWQFNTGVEIRINYFQSRLFNNYGFHTFYSFSLTDSFLQKVSIPNCLFVEIEISRNFIDFLDVRNCTTLHTLIASSNQLTNENIVGLSSCGVTWSDNEVFNGVVPKRMDRIILSGNKLTQVPFFDRAENYVADEYDISNNLISGTFKPLLFSPETINISFNDFLSVDFGDNLYYRPKNFDCSFNPRLTTIDENIQNGRWQTVRYLKCNNCRISSIDFPAGVVPIEFLDVSYNSLTTLEISSCTNLRYLYANNNNLNSLTPPGKHSDGIERDIVDTGADDYDFVYLNSYRLTECDISTNNFTENPFTVQYPGFTDRYWDRANGLRYLNISNNPLQRLGSNAPPIGYSKTTTWGTNSGYRMANGYGFDLVLPGDIVIFTNRTNCNEVFMIDPSEYISWDTINNYTPTTQQYDLTDRISAIPTDKNSYISRETSKVRTTGLENLTSLATRHYSSRRNESVMFLSKLICNDCPNLTYVSLVGLTGLDSLELRNNPNLAEINTGISDRRDTPLNIFGAPAWGGGPAFLKSIVITNCPKLVATNSFYFTNKYSALWDRLIVSNCGMLTFIGLLSNAACRKGVDFSRNNFTDARLPNIINAFGFRSLVGSGDPGDSNIIDVSGNPGPFSSASYLSAKNTANARGWWIKQS
jgi:hypothetical protein